VNVELKLFAVARQLAGCETVEIELPDQATVGELRDRLVEQVPALVSLRDQLLFAVNAQYADLAAAIPPGAEVACIPPVSGG